MATLQQADNAHAQLLPLFLRSHRAMDGEGYIEEMRPELTLRQQQRWIENILISSGAVGRKGRRSLSKKKN